MTLQDLHVHTTFSDGKNTPEEMVEAAIAKGMTCIGFSDHGYTPQEDGFCIPKDRMQLYQDTINQLKEKYRDHIKILCGIEQDTYYLEKPKGFDYIIGSVHFIQCNDEMIPVDEDLDTLIRARDKYFDGDAYAMAEKYFSIVADVVDHTDADIIGHMDLITKTNKNGILFDENHPRYINAWKKAVDRLVTKHVPFEINTGGMFRGYRDVPYPPKSIQAYILFKGGKMIYGSDSHSKEALCFAFEQI